MKPSDNPISEVNLLQSQGTQQEENKSSDMKQKMREKGFDIESILNGEDNNITQIEKELQLANSPQKTQVKKSALPNKAESPHSIH